MSLTQLFLSLTISCFHCGESVDLKSLPLCPDCKAALKNSRALDLDLGDPVDSGKALYLLSDSNYPILKSWKKRRGPTFDHQVLKHSNAEDIRNWVNQKPGAVITPLPQNSARAFKLGGSPASVLASWLSGLSGIPCMDLLEAQKTSGKRQAELDSWNRLMNPLEFKLVGKAPETVILVDDFITTGHTVREAARALKLGGVLRVHVFGLGAGQSPVKEELHLLKRA